MLIFFLFLKQKAAYEMRISDWSSDVCSSDLGLTVIVTAGSDEKCARAREVGAAHAINYKTQDFVEEIKRIAPGGAAVVLDLIGGDYVPRNLDQKRVA